MSEERCNRCGKESSRMKKPCKTKDTAEISAFYICEDCHKKTTSAEAVCTPKEISPSYVCKKCGSPSVSKKSLCKPKSI